MYTLRQEGNTVLINDVRIPAVNIQVEDISEGYDTYFEILFEDGALWIIEAAGCEFPDMDVKIIEYDRWAKGFKSEPSYARFHIWDTFLIMYKMKARGF